MALRILVVDDHDVVRQGVRLILRDRPDWQICGEAENGAQALQKERQLRPDLIILDVTMPDIGGLQVASELHSRNSPRPVCLCFAASFLDQALQFVVLAPKRLGLLPILLLARRSTNHSHGSTRLRPEKSVEDRYFFFTDLAAAAEAGNHPHRLPAGVDAGRPCAAQHP
jgi:CheY-like chemotaxis protein